jgi:tryptophanyl-tRNA synthetase
MPETSEKIKKAVTDSYKEIIVDPEKKPAISNLITIYHLLSRNSINEIERKYEGKSYVEFKNDLAEIIVDFLKPFQEKRRELEGNITYVEKVLAESENKAREIASKTLEEVKIKVGIY